MVSGTSDGRTLELFVRSLASGEDSGPAHAQRVRALAAAGDVREASITVWGEEVGLSTTAIRTPMGKAILDDVAALRSWVDERDVTMVPFFESRQVTADVTGEAYTALRLPVSCLAEYVDGELVHVAPHTDGTSVCTVDDRLQRLESGDGARGTDAGSVERAVTH
jgi:hypothetical protein